MSKKSLIGLLLFGLLTLTGLFIGVKFMIDQGSTSGLEQDLTDPKEQENAKDLDKIDQATKDDVTSTENSVDLTQTEPWLQTNPSDTGLEEPLDQSDKEDNGSDKTVKEPIESENYDVNENGIPEVEEQVPEVVETGVASANENNPEQGSEDSLETSAVINPLQLIDDHEKIDYMAYVPEMVIDSQLEIALDIANPDIDIEAKSAILFDALTGEILYHKAAVDPVFPASTAKLLNALVALDWCDENEEVTLGSEIKMKTLDSSTAYLNIGQILTVRNLLEGMLVPSGNDAAYAMAAYVGRKSLKNPSASCQEAVLEFVRLMNQKAKELGVKNSCFMTPDGYDAIGQYTTAYDMGMIGLAAIKNETIVEISRKVKARNVFVSGEDVTWENTNALINKNSGGYYSCAVGLKTGTSSMAGKCLVTAGRKDGREVLCVIMNSTTYGRWEDAVKLLKYGLNQ